MPHQTFLIEGCDPVDTWHWLPWKGPGHPHHIFSASSRTWALPWSLALLICSSSRPWAESHGSSGSSFFFGLFSALFSESVNFALVFLYNFSVPCSVFYDCRNGSEVSAAQLLLWLPSVVRIWGPLPLQEILHFAFSTRWSGNVYITYSSSSSSSTSSTFLFCFFPRARQLSSLKCDAAQSRTQECERKRRHPNGVWDWWWRWPPEKGQISSVLKLVLVLAVETQVNIALWLRVWSLESEYLDLNLSSFTREPCQS